MARLLAAVTNVCCDQASTGVAGSETGWVTNRVLCDESLSLTKIHAFQLYQPAVHTNPISHDAKVQKYIYIYIYILNAFILIIIIILLYLCCDNYRI